MVNSGSYIDVRYIIQVNGSVVSSRLSSEIKSDLIDDSLEVVPIVNSQIVYSTTIVNITADGAEYFNVETLAETFTDEFVSSDFASEYTETFNTLSKDIGMYILIYFSLSC